MENKDFSSLATLQSALFSRNGQIVHIYAFANSNYVSNFNRVGVPQNIAIILKLTDRLLEKKVSKEEIFKIIENEVKEFKTK